MSSRPWSMIITRILNANNPFFKWKNPMTFEKSVLFGLVFFVVKKHLTLSFSSINWAEDLEKSMKGSFEFKHLKYIDIQMHWLWMEINRKKGEMDLTCSIWIATKSKIKVKKSVQLVPNTEEDSNSSNISWQKYRI